MVCGRSSMSEIQYTHPNPLLIDRYHYHVFQNPQTSNLYHLVASLLVDLGLNCPPDRLNDQKLRLPTRLLQSPIGRRESRSMPELRALLGCYYTSSVYVTLRPSLYFRIRKGMPFSDTISVYGVPLKSLRPYLTHRTSNRHAMRSSIPRSSLRMR